jgi:transcriptional regulator with XRE-family HTH domain
VKTLAQKFGECVREMRLEMGLSQVEFGERCGFYQTYLSRIENGQANPTLNAVEVIATALDMTVFELFELVKEAPHKRRATSNRKPRE